MTILPTGMKVRNRKGFVVKVFCIVFFSSLIIYALHFYRKVYNFAGRRSYLIDKFSEYHRGRSLVMEGSGSGVGPLPADSSGSIVYSQGAHVQGSPIVKLENKIVHFDLKGMPFKTEAFKIIFPFLKSIGATGVLMEYEDMFPFQGKLAGIANKKAYSVSDIQMMLDWAKESNLQVIPLVQTFGHLEFVLKLEEFSALREVYRFPQVICPTNNNSLALVRDMIDQVMSLHPNAQYLHIGSDEVYHIGVCRLCQDRMERDRINPPDLFLQHVKFVASYVREKFKVQPLMWDDEFRNLDDRVIESYGIGDLVEIVVWNYRPDVETHLRPAMWAKYSKIFKSAWAGSAFKGAMKPNSITANETFYLSNHYSWMNVIFENQQQINFKGIILTGWTRYDHFSVLCEIFPAAVPSLVSCLLYLGSSGQPTMEKIFGLASSFLQCESNRMFCQFPGSQIYNDIIALANAQSNLKRIKEEHVFLGWTQEVNFQFQFSNPGHAESILQEVIKVRLDLQRVQTSLTPALKTMFPDWSVYEWMLTNHQPIATEVNILENKLHNLSKKTTFPVRPLAFPENSDDTLE